MLPILIASAVPERKQPFRIISEDLMWLQISDNDTICNGLMNVSLTSTFIPPLQIHFSDNAKSVQNCTIHKIIFAWRFWIFHSLWIRRNSRDALCLEGPYRQNIILFQYIQYVFCYPLTENIDYKQRGLYILKL